MLGYIDTDTLTVGTPNITVAKQGLGEALRVSNDFVATSCDGLFVRALALFLLAMQMLDSLHILLGTYQYYYWTIEKLPHDQKAQID